MSDQRDVSRIPLQVSQDCVIASIQVDLDEQVLQRFRTDLLAMIESASATGVILDLSGVEVLDRTDFEALQRTMAMTALMGARCVVAGLRPGVASALVDLDVDLDSVEAAFNLDDAWRLLGDTASPNKGEDDEGEEQLHLLDDEQSLDYVPDVDLDELEP